MIKKIRLRFRFILLVLKALALLPFAAIMLMMSFLLASIPALEEMSLETDKYNA